MGHNGTISSWLVTFDGVISRGQLVLMAYFAELFSQSIDTAICVLKQ